MIRTTLLDHDHVDVTSSQLQLALLLQAEGALDEAAGAMERCLATQGGNRHLAGATAHNDYALSASGGAGAGDHTLHPLVAALHHHLAAVALQRADFAAGTPWVIVMGWVAGSGSPQGSARSCGCPSPSSTIPEATTTVWALCAKRRHQHHLYHQR